MQRLLPYHSNVGKRLVKSPKIYLRDSGLLHALPGITNLDELAGHSVIGKSWGGFVIESLLAAAPEHVGASFYATAAGAEIDLVLEFGGTRGRWEIEVKRSLSARPTRRFFHSLEDSKPAKAFVVSAGLDRYRLSGGVEAISLSELAAEIADV